jgi:hypothetical protein
MAKERKWKYRWDISNDDCKADAFKELVQILAKLKPEHVTRFKVSVWRNPPEPRGERKAERARE